jgi:hypothetical protein
MVFPASSYTHKNENYHLIEVPNSNYMALFSRVLASHHGGLGSIPGQDMSVPGPLVKDGDNLAQVSP